MLRHERRLLFDSLRIGIALTGLVVACDLAGLLTPAENFFYDIRARLCQHFSPPPSDKLVHVDIDDAALEAMGAFPWPRRKVAQVFDEIRLAGPKAVETDILFSEPQLVQYQPYPTTAQSQQPASTAPATTRAASAPATQQVEYERIDNDAELAASIARLGNVIVPANLAPVERASPRYAAEVEELVKDIELEEGVLAERLRQRGIAIPDTGIGDQFYPARREAIARRLEAMHVTPDVPFARIRAQLMPKTPVDIHPGVENVLKEQWEKFLARQAFRERNSLPVPEGMIHLTNMQLALTPLRPYTLAAEGGAFVDYTKFGSAVIRAVPLLLEQDGRVYPQMGLALACRMLDADMTEMRIDNDVLLVPRRGGLDVKIPLAPPRVSTEGYRIGTLMDIPWFGGHRWETMYDFPAHQAEKQHVPLALVWQACYAKQKIRTNVAMADEALLSLYQKLDPPQVARYLAARPGPEDFEARVPRIRAALLDAQPYVEEFEKLSATEIPADWEEFLPSVRALKNLPEQTTGLAKELKQLRADLASRVQGKAVLIGWTATGAVADFIPTSLHERCPGMVVHGVVFNGIMTGEMWRRSGAWVAAVIACVLGVLTALVVGYFSPMRALFIAVALAMSYALVNGFLLFDYGNRIVGAAGPFAAIAVAWGGCTLTRVMIEAAERKRITARFSNYVDPKLVSWVQENPDFRFDGEKREMTVVFTDLAGFTSISEKLGEKVVPMLNELLGELVPVIRDHHAGLVNKFLGDGIMFFFNAPKKDPRHVDDAVETVLDMHIAIERFNGEIAKRGLPRVGLRAGICAGEMIVGDAGGGGAADYTVLGDAVNLAARLEAANKIVGTDTLINARAAELLDGQILIRPVGRLQVVGQEQANICYEPICRAKDATDQQKELAAMTTMIVDAFITKRFNDCLKFVAQMETALGAGKLTAIYREMCEKYLHEPPAENFDGRIVLTQK